MSTRLGWVQGTETSLRRGFLFLGASVTQEQVTHLDLQQQIAHLDRRVIVLETEMHAVRHDVKENAAIAKRIGERVDEVYRMLGELSGGQKMLVWMFGVGIPALIGINLWNILG